MIIIVDSREQKPLEFSHPFIEDVVVEKLEYGDYGCRFTDGYRPKIYFERKSLSVRKKRRAVSGLIGGSPWAS